MADFFIAQNKYFSRISYQWKNLNMIGYQAYSNVFLRTCCVCNKLLHINESLNQSKFKSKWIFGNSPKEIPILCCKLLLILLKINQTLMSWWIVTQVTLSHLTSLKRFITLRLLTKRFIEIYFHLVLLAIPLQIKTR